jgi:HlyD family secretion protein
MEVQVTLNESVVVRVRPGQRASISFEAIPDLLLEGRVESIGQIPFLEIVGNGQQRMDTGVRYFVGIVKLDRVSERIRPGMTAMVDFRLARRRDVLAIPHQAVRSAGGKKICYVAHDESLERREVKIGQDTAEMIEVLDGLREGDMVALNPPGTAAHVEQLLSFDYGDRPAHGDHDNVAASQP